MPPLNVAWQDDTELPPGPGAMGLYVKTGMYRNGKFVEPGDYQTLAENLVARMREDEAFEKEYPDGGQDFLIAAAIIIGLHKLSAWNDWPDHFVERIQNKYKQADIAQLAIACALIQAEMVRRMKQAEDINSGERP